MHGAATVADLLLDRADDDRPGCRFGPTVWTWAEVVAASAARGVTLVERLAGKAGPPHVGVLLDNVPEYLFWLGGAALTGATVVGINPTRRGPHLARDLAATDCRLLVTDGAGAELLAGAGVDAGSVLVVGTGDRPDSRGGATAGTGDRTGAGDGAGDDATVDPRRLLGALRPVEPSTLFVLLFTSGTTGHPKAVRCSQGRLAAIATTCVDLFDFRRDDVCFCPMPLFHGNAVMSLWAPALAAGATVALAGRFSARRFVDEVRRHGATRFTYVGKALSYILETPPRPDDADTPLRLGFGTEASAAERRRFEARFGCRLVEGYGSSEGGIAINVVPGTPPGSLGRPARGDVAVVDPATGLECPPARFDGGGGLVNGDVAIGEIVDRAGAPGFEGYYGDEEAAAARTQGGWYWSGDLGYRDEAGWFYFAGRSGDWLRVDSENFAAGPVEQVLAQHPDVAACLVYPVPDVVGGDQVMAALVLRPGARFDPDNFAAFLDGRPDLGTKWAPRFVRLLDDLPVTATGKPTKTGLRSEGWWDADGPLVWRPGRQLAFVPFDEPDRARLLAGLADNGRAHLARGAGAGSDQA